MIDDASALSRPVVYGRPVEVTAAEFADLRRARPSVIDRPGALVRWSQHVYVGRRCADGSLSVDRHRVVLKENL